MDAGKQSQSEAVAFLQQGAGRAHAEAGRIDTHCAAVFLIGERAYKLKRAVKYPYLDYSTLEKRRQALEAELAINKEIAPQIYERVEAIVRDQSGTLRLEGDGDIVDYVLVMRRFDENATLDRIADQRPLSNAEIDDLAKIIARMHANATSANADLWIKDLRAYILDNAEALKAFQQSEEVTSAALEELERVKPVIAERGRLGLVRRCHGDLHLGNIVLIDNQPTPFDAIEFDERVATGDVLYDLAFVVMDLWERGHRREANRLINRYLVEARRSEDFAALDAFPFYLHLRAAIRAKTTMAKAEFVSGKARETALAEAARYWAFARTALDRADNRLVTVGGLSGTGKTTLAYAIAPYIEPAPGAIVIRSDVVRKQLCDAAETAHLPESAYDQKISDRVFETMEVYARRVLGAGLSVVCDAVYAKPTQRRAIEETCRRAGASFIGIWLDASIAARIARISRRPADASDADARVAQQQERIDIGELNWIPLDAMEPPSDLARQALCIVNEGVVQESAKAQA